MKKLLSVILCVSLMLSLCVFAHAENTEYKVGICNWVDDASLNQIVENIMSQLEAIGEEKGVTFDITYQNPNADAAVMNQIIADFIADDVDLMIAIATPVAQAMMGATSDNQIPVVFAAVSDPVGAGLVESMDAPGGNITGTSDGLNTQTVFDLIFTADPEADLIGLLYDVGQDASLGAIATAKEILDAKGVAYKEYPSANVPEVILAADAMAADGVKAAFTPTDNTIMTAELSIYETLAAAGIPHYCGADSFALNGAFLGFGVNYIDLGKATGDLAAKVLLEGADPATTAVVTFDNGIATINTETAAALGIDFDTVAEAFAPFCTSVQPITTAEEFGSAE